MSWLRRNKRFLLSTCQKDRSSVFTTLGFSENGQVLIILTGFEHGSFSYILVKLAPLYTQYTPYSFHCDMQRLMHLARRLRKHPAVQGPASFLTWAKIVGPCTLLHVMNDVVTSIYPFFLRSGRCILLHILHNTIAQQYVYHQQKRPMFSKHRLRKSTLQSIPTAP